MKRCPQCNRVETDEALKYCRVDGATLFSDSWSIDSEAGTVQLGSSSSSNVNTDTLAQTTAAKMYRATAPTTVLNPQPSPSTTDEFRITAKTRIKLSVF